MLKKRDKHWIFAIEMKCYLWALKISWQQKVTNIVVRNHMGAKRNIVQIVMERKLNSFGIFAG